MRLQRQKEWALFGMELRQFYADRQNLKFIPLTLLAIAFALWPYIGSPLVPVVLVVFAGLEPQLNNVLFRTPLEYEALSLFPPAWKNVVIAKNLSTVVITLSLFLIIAVIVEYFSPEAVSLRELGQALLYLLTIIFPLLSSGNRRSVQHPRRHTGWETDQVAESVVLLVVVGIFSLPYFILEGLPGGDWTCLLYGVLTSIFWFRKSIPGTEARILASHTRLCLTP